MDQTLLLSMLLSQLCWSVSLDLQYHFIDKKMTWSEAQSHCREFYTDLASVNDMKDLKNLKAAANGRTDAWIGLHQTNSSLIGETDIRKNWHWSQPTVRNEIENNVWDGVEPNNPDSEKCACLNSMNKWNNLPCETTKCFICYNESSNTTVMITDTKTWLEAQRYCRTNHTDLMSGRDQQKQFEQKYPGSARDECWIGLFWHIWRWSDGSDSSFSNWKSSNSLTDDKKEKCAALGDEGLWESSKCDVKKTFICHRGSFVLVKENKTFEEALIHCRDNHHDLVWSIDTEPWKSKARKEIQKADGEFVWVGLHFACFFEEWFWVDGNYVSATNENWGDSVVATCGDVAAVKKTDKKWYKKNLREKFNFICLRSCPCNG